MNTDKHIKLRTEIIYQACKSLRNDYKFNSIVFIFYVKEVRSLGLTFEHVLPFFKSEIDEMFDILALKDLGRDPFTQDRGDKHTVFKRIKSALTKAAKRCERLSGTKNKGTDAGCADPLTPIRSMFERKSVSNLASAFQQLKDENRQKEILKALYQKLPPESKTALYLELKFMDRVL